jgi:hypothetical protein
MPSIINDTIHNEVFIRKVKELFKGKLLDKSGTAYDTKEGCIEGTVTQFEFQSEPVFETPVGDGLNWSITFKAIGEATIDYKTPDGEDGDGEIEGPCEGIVEITFPNDTLSLDSIDEILKEADIEITDESATLRTEEC